MNEVRFHYYYPIHLNIPTDKQVDVYIDMIEGSPVPENHIRIMILEEPKKDRVYDFVKNNPQLYTHLLTFHEELLKDNSKAIRFHSMTAWVRDYHSTNKTFSVSTVVGGKKDSVMEGYGIRHALWKNRHRITIPKRFYLSGTAQHFHQFKPWKDVDYRGQLVLGASKEPLFDSMFHVAIENTSIKNYFSEKLVDCFQAHTVPIYYGCKNIGDFFNKEGIIQVNSLEGLIEACNLMTPEIYRVLKPAMEDNYNRSLEWLDNQEQIRRAILKIIE